MEWPCREETKLMLKKTIPLSTSKIVYNMEFKYYHTNVLSPDLKIRATCIVTKPLLK